MKGEPRPLFLQEVAAALVPGATVSGVVPGAAAWVVAECVVDRPLLVVVPGHDEAAVLAADLRFHLAGRAPALVLPADDVRPWEGLSPDPALVRDRVVALDALDRRIPCAVVLPASALAQRVLPAAALRDARARVDRGSVPAGGRDGLIRRLAQSGYSGVGRVEEAGTFSVRGGTVEVWPVGAAAPVRVELMGDEVDAIRVVEGSGRSGERLEGVTLLPAREALATDDALARASALTARVVDELGAGQATRRRALEELRSGLWFPGAEDYLAALHPVVPVWEFAQSLVVVDRAGVEIEYRRAVEEGRARWETIPADRRPPVPPDHRWAPFLEARPALDRAVRIETLAPDAPDLGTRDNGILAVGAGDLDRATDRFRAWLEEGWQVALVADSRARAERVAELLRSRRLAPRTLAAGRLPPPGVLGIWLGALSAGFHAPLSRIAVVSADEVFGHKLRPEPAAPERARLSDSAIRSFAQLTSGDLVVHARHGIGRFDGLARVPVDGIDQDFVRVRYRDDDLLLLPVLRLGQLSRYRAMGDVVPKLDRLGGETWARRKARVRDRVLAMAHEILRLHAMRTVQPAPACPGLPDAYRQFEEAFPWVETPDQEVAVRDVLDDLAKDEPMDRLIVGDVGFGKTEVAMRAAMRVVLEGRQVAVLCPTTVLAFQHRSTFAERFAGQPVRIELLSRFRTPAEARTVLAATERGEVDVLIGTHALLGRGLRFPRLGLVVADEEHRFGVRQKERLKRLATGVHYLAMSATPIPRSLHMALSGLRKVSLIATPPARRLAVRVRIGRRDPARIREEVLYEIGRGGQVYFVHNRVEAIGGVREELAALLPGVRLGLAHGKQDRHELETALVDFIERRTDVLVCTTIIESGTDLPNVNTMLVDRADQLGLAQLYQLRGRVGRGPVQAYCTLLLPGHEAGLASEVVDRLRVIQHHGDLGGGMAIAMADLEMRGAGELLGDSQHGHVQAVGLDAYAELLGEAVAAAGGDLARDRIDPEIEVPVPALIPESYMPDIEDRLAAYRAVAIARTPSDVRGWMREWEDRFGAHPPEVLNLGWMAETRVRCRDLAIRRVSWLKQRVAFEFDGQSSVSGFARLAVEEPQRFQSDRPLALDVRFTPEEAAWPFRFLHWVLRRLETLPGAPGAGAG